MAPPDLENGKVTPLFRWEVFKYPWGSAVREQRTGKMSR